MNSDGCSSSAARVQMQRTAHFFTARSFLCFKSMLWFSLLVIWMLAWCLKKQVGGVAVQETSCWREMLGLSYSWISVMISWRSFKRPLTLMEGSQKWRKPIAWSSPSSSGWAELQLFWNLPGIILLLVAVGIQRVCHACYCLGISRNKIIHCQSCWC